jgi:hypothetical protein
MDLALNLKKTNFKKRTVTREVLKKSWMYVIRHISSREELLV